MTGSFESHLQVQESAQPCLREPLLTRTTHSLAARQTLVLLTDVVPTRPLRVGQAAPRRDRPPWITYHPCRSAREPVTSAVGPSVVGPGEHRWGPAASGGGARGSWRRHWSPVHWTRQRDCSCSTTWATSELHMVGRKRNAARLFNIVFRSLMPHAARSSEQYKHLNAAQLLTLCACW